MAFFAGVSRSCRALPATVSCAVGYSAAGKTSSSFAIISGVAGWWLNSRVLKRQVLPKGQLAAFKWLMPLLKREEQHPPSFGMSLLVLATKR